MWCYFPVKSCESSVIFNVVFTFFNVSLYQSSSLLFSRAYKCYAKNTDFLTVASYLIGLNYSDFYFFPLADLAAETLVESFLYDYLFNLADNPSVVVNGLPEAFEAGPLVPPSSLVGVSGLMFPVCTLILAFK